MHSHDLFGLIGLKNEAEWKWYNETLKFHYLFMKIIFFLSL